MQKKSALSAALRGNAPASTPPNSQQPANLKLPDNFAFPCLACAPDDGSSVIPVLDDISEVLDKVDLNSITLAGSAPTMGLLPNGTPLADYPLNPYRRRGGKEGMPSSLVASMEEHKMSHGNSMTSNFLSEAVIGSLPKGLTDEEKLQIRMSTPMSPAMNMLSEMPTTKVSSRTLEGRKLRRQVLKGSVVVFVTAGYSGKRFIFEKAKELGVKSVVLDGPDSWVQLLEAEGVIEKFVPIDFADADTVFSRCLEALKKVTSSLGGIDGVTTFCEMAVPLVSRLAEKLGLTSNLPSAVDAARDKYQTRECLQQAGLPSPKHYSISKPEDVGPAADHVGFPAVIKPVSGAASIGVIRVNDREQLEKAYARVIRDMKKAKVVAGALSQGDDDDNQEEEKHGNADSWINLMLMLEEYLDGPEVDCDLILSDGLCVYGAVTDNWPTVEPYFNETGSNCPSILPRRQQKELIELSVKSVLALGLRHGVFHVEAKYTSRGPRLIEVNCRMGGGPVRDTNLLVWGVDLVEEHLMCSVGIPSRPPLARKPLMEIAEYSVNAKKTGILQNTDFLKPWQNHPDVLYARPLVKAGEKCVCVEDGLPTWVCELMVTKPTVQEAIDFIKHIESSLVIPIV